MLLLIFSPYLLVPLGMAVLEAKNCLPWKALSWIIPLVLLVSYPFLFVQVQSLSNPKQADYQCGMPEFAFIAVCLFLCLPASLLWQTVFSFLFGLGPTSTRQA